MVALANPTALHGEGDMTPGTGAEAITVQPTAADPAATLAPGRATVAAGHDVIGQAGSAVDPFNMTEVQIKSNRDILTFSGVPLHRGRKK